MPRRQSRPHPLPSIWLMTDERQGEGLWEALERLPHGAGVIFRHRSLARGERRALFERVRVIARRRGLLLVLAGTARDAIGWRADGVHGHLPGRAARPLIRTAPAHDARELHAAAGADLVLLSPVFPTRSHPGARTLGWVRFGLLARRARAPVVALGGMDARRGPLMSALGAVGWAGIDAWAISNP